MDKKIWQNIFAGGCLFAFGGAALWGAEPIYIGVSAPLTGNYAEYGQNWKKAMDLGLGWINAAGRGKWPAHRIDLHGQQERPQGVGGGGSEILAATNGLWPPSATSPAPPAWPPSRSTIGPGWFSSPPPLPIPSSPREHLVLRNHRHPGGRRTLHGPLCGPEAGKKKIAVLYINNDWGIATKDYFVKPAKEMGAEIVAIESSSRRTRISPGS